MPLQLAVDAPGRRDCGEQHRRHLRHFPTRGTCHQRAGSCPGCPGHTHTSHPQMRCFSQRSAQGGEVKRRWLWITVDPCNTPDHSVLSAGRRPSANLLLISTSWETWYETVFETQTISENNSIKTVVKNWRHICHFPQRVTRLDINILGLSLSLTSSSLTLLLGYAQEGKAKRVRITTEYHHCLLSPISRANPFN